MVGMTIKMNLQLDTSVQYVPRVGPAMAQRLEKLGIRTVGELLFYIPFRYNDFSRIVTIRNVSPGTLVTIDAEVQSIRNVFTKNGKKMQEAVVKDPTGQLSVVWFNQLFLPKIIHQGDRISLSGTIGFFGNKLVMESPDYEIHNEDDHEMLHTGRFVPVYSETAGVSSKWLRGRISHLLSLKHTFLSERIPRTILETYHLLGISDALSQVHFPKSFSQAEDGKKRLSFDELFFLQLTSSLRKKHWEQFERAPVYTVEDKNVQTFISQLPFILTDDQKKAIQHICADLVRPYPMNRLLEGDVGSGKTVVAALALYLSAVNGYTSVLMAPTQILAEQHYNTIQQLLVPFNIPISLVLGNNKNIKPDARNPKSEVNTKQSKNLRTTNHEQPSIFIGTHALLQEKVDLQNVGLVIIDEQQRFGVSQRAIIRKKGTNSLTPHFFTMTATPIPRTLALTVYGNLDLSILSQMPKGRTPIKTWVVPKEKRTNAYAWMKKELSRFDTRIFIVCPFIEESESMSTVKAAKQEFEHIQKDIFPDIPIGLLHGRLKSNEKTKILDAFRSGEVKILVTTPVVEVGIDIKEASIMVIEGAERFGLSQLHQLRGRVGRGDLVSYCLLFSESTESRSLERLKILESVKNGPELAEYDLHLRGEGDVLGIRQHGLPALTIASLRDKNLVEDAQQAVRTILDMDPDLTQFPLLRDQTEKDTIDGSIQD